MITTDHSFVLYGEDKN